MEHSATKVLVIEDTFATLADGLNGPKRARDRQDRSRQRAQGTRRQRRPTAPRRVVRVHVGHHRASRRGFAAPIPSGDPDQVANDAAVFGRAFDFRPFDGPMLVSTGMFHGGSHRYYMGGLNVGQRARDHAPVRRRGGAAADRAASSPHRLHGADAVPAGLLALPEEVRQTYDVSSLHSIVHSAAPCPMAVKQRMMEWWGPVIWETYGGMEGAATIAKPHRWLEKPGTVGRAVRGVSLAILDDDGNELPPGEIGQVYMENDVGFTYHDDDEGTAEAYLGARGSASAISATSTRTATCSSPAAPRT